MRAAPLELSMLANSPAVIDDAPDVLAAIADPAVQLAVWRRGRLAALDWIDALAWDEIDDVDARVDDADNASAIWGLLGAAGYPQDARGRLLFREIADLAALFSQLMGCSGLRLRLDVIETDACRKFHMDYVTARLLMPLSGTGTQWRLCEAGAEAPINQLGCGDVGIFKGRLSVGEPAILHRSPPIGATGETRLLLVLDPAGASTDALEVPDARRDATKQPRRRALRIGW